jgi:transcriptional regulator with XRE-family HTH domain
LSSYEQAREALGAELRQLRKTANLTGKQLAEQLGWHQSKVSRIETGQQTATEDDVAAWTRVADAPSDVTNNLLARLANIKVEYKAWRGQHRVGARVKQQDLLDLEARTTEIRAFDSAMVPGLLQTAEYARWQLSGAPEWYGAPDDVAEAVKVRMRRQEILYEPSRRFRFLLTEAALRYWLCPVETMRGQLDRLIALSTLANVELGIIPLDLRLPIPPLHGFWVFDDQLVTVETFGAELRLRESVEIELYSNIFDALREAAHRGDVARTALTRILEELPHQDEAAGRPAAQ